MAQRILIKGGTVITVDRELGDFATGDVLGAIVAVCHSIEAGDVERLDGDWIPQPYEGA